MYKTWVAGPWIHGSTSYNDNNYVGNFLWVNPFHSLATPTHAHFFTYMSKWPYTLRHPISLLWKCESGCVDRDSRLDSHGAGFMSSRKMVGEVLLSRVNTALEQRIQKKAHWNGRRSSWDSQRLPGLPTVFLAFCITTHCSWALLCVLFSQEVFYIVRNCIEKACWVYM